LCHTGSLSAASRLGGGPNIEFATAFLAGFAEWVCVEALRPALAEDETSIGTLLYLNHEADSAGEPVLTVRAELVDLHGTQLRFRIDCFAGETRIGTGFHERKLAHATSLADAA
jgi:fluoroacetyl-CoA thioesterase